MLSFAKDVHVKGCYRKDGTYVQPYTRSVPNRYKWSNYGAKSKDSQSYNDRDMDSDGIYNQYDYDDNGDGISDDNE